MAKRSKSSMAGNIKKSFSFAGKGKLDPTKIAEQNAHSIEQIGNVMMMLSNILSGQEQLFGEMIDILSQLPENNIERQRQAELITKKTIDAILKIEKQIEKETDPEKKKKLQEAANVLKTQGASAYSVAKPQRLPSTFSEMLQNAIFGITPDKKQQAGGILPAIGNVAKEKLALGKMMFGLFPKQKTGAEGFESLLSQGRKKIAGQDIIEKSSSMYQKLMNQEVQKETTSKKKKATVIPTPKETLDFYDNVLEGLNLVVMNQDKTNELLANLTPQEDTSEKSPSPATASAIPDKPTTTADDLVSGYGERVLVTPTGSYALNNEDDVIAGTNLFPKGSVRTGGMLASGSTSGAQLLSASSRTDADDIANMALATSPAIMASTAGNGNVTGGGGTVINNIDNSSNVSASGGGGESASVVYIRDVHNSHVRFQQKRLTSLLA